MRFSSLSLSRGQFQSDAKPRKISQPSTYSRRFFTAALNVLITSIKDDIEQRIISSVSDDSTQILNFITLFARAGEESIPHFLSSYPSYNRPLALLTRTKSNITSRTPHGRAQSRRVSTECKRRNMCKSRISLGNWSALCLCGGSRSGEEHLRNIQRALAVFHFRERVRSYCILDCAFTLDMNMMKTTPVREQQANPILR
eukprot:IDg7614t1